MPNLTDDELKKIINDSLQASLVGDRDALIAALTPLEDRGDYGDAYLVTVYLIQMVKRALPPIVCPVHGPGSDCSPVVGIGIVAVDPDTGAAIPMGEDGGVFGSVTPEIQQEYPDTIGYSRMLAAELNGDDDTSLALWHAAIQGEYAERILFVAIEQAADAFRATKSSLQ